MADTWPTLALDTVAELTGGYAFKSEEYAPSGRFVLRTLNIKDDGRINREQGVYIPLSECAPYERFELQTNDILFVMVGATLGKIGIVTERDLPALLNQNMWRVRAINGKVDSRFLFYAFKHSAAAGLAGASGSARLFVRRDDYRRLLIPFPPANDQLLIASLLGFIDDQIDLISRMNTTLDAMARVIFKDWFVDFGPTRAKMERGPRYLSQDLWEIFPARLDEEGKPTGWKMSALGDVVDVRHGFAFQGEYFRSTPPGDILLTPGNFAMGGGFREAKDRYYAGPVPEEYVLNEDDLLITMTDLSKAGDTLGYPAFVPPPTNGQRFLHNQRLGKVLIVRPDEVKALFLYSVLCSESYRAEILAGATGTTVKHTSPGRIKNFCCVLPSHDVMRAFDETVSPLWQQIKANRNRSDTLRQLRDVLLPKLMSGEVRIKDTIKKVEAVL